MTFLSQRATKLARCVEFLSFYVSVGVFGVVLFVVLAAFAVFAVLTIL